MKMNEDEDEDVDVDVDDSVTNMFNEKSSSILENASLKINIIDIQLEKGFATNANKNAEPEGSATNANKNVKSSAKTPAPTGPSDDSTGPDLTDDL
ncbi:hypothetical protein RhiirA5_505768 [Rhizophagus irregularis]|nr:hypothetical protein RhiirA5_505768 [Rhizophagus irregularis]PKY30975.1 hypothetical protein RhiirB3_531353 [Rhizophagus irregularis]